MSVNRVSGGSSTTIRVRYDGTEPDRGGGGRKPYIRGKLGENTMNINFKSMAKIGLGIRQSRMANEAVGAYTQNRLKQARFNAAVQFATYGIGIAKFGVFGAVYAAGDLGYKAVMYEIDRGKKNRFASHIREISGIGARSNSRHQEQTP